MRVVHQRLVPALQSIGVPRGGLVVCSLEPQSGLTGLPHQYYQVGPACLLPLDCLYEQGFLGHDTLWIVATPPAWHVPYLVQLAGRCRTAVEKPLAATSHQARLLRSFAEGCEVYCLNHKVFNAAVLAFVETCRPDPGLLRQVYHIEGVFYEMAGISHGRQQEDGIIDVQWHLFTTAANGRGVRPVAGVGRSGVAGRGVTPRSTSSNTCSRAGRGCGTSAGSTSSSRMPCGTCVMDITSFHS
jgi:hypothetical protein